MDKLLSEAVLLRSTLLNAHWQAFYNKDFSRKDRLSKLLVKADRRERRRWWLREGIQYDLWYYGRGFMAHENLTTIEAVTYLAEHGYVVGRRRVGGSGTPSVDTLKHWARGGRLVGAYKRDNRWFIPKAALDILLDDAPPAERQITDERYLLVKSIRGDQRWWLSIRPSGQGIVLDIETLALAERLAAIIPTCPTVEAVIALAVAKLAEHTDD